MTWCQENVFGSLWLMALVKILCQYFCKRCCCADIRDCKWLVPRKYHRMISVTCGPCEQFVSIFCKSSCHEDITTMSNINVNSNGSITQSNPKQRVLLWPMIGSLLDSHILTDCSKTQKRCSTAQQTCQPSDDKYQTVPSCEPHDIVVMSSQCITCLGNQPRGQVCHLWRSIGWVFLVKGGNCWCVWRLAKFAHNPIMTREKECVNACRVSCFSVSNIISTSSHTTAPATIHVIHKESPAWVISQHSNVSRINE